MACGCSSPLLGDGGGRQLDWGAGPTRACICQNGPLRSVHCTSLKFHFIKKQDGPQKAYGRGVEGLPLPLDRAKYRGWSLTPPGSSGPESLPRLSTVPPMAQLHSVPLLRSLGWWAWGSAGPECELVRPLSGPWPKLSPLRNRGLRSASPALGRGPRAAHTHSTCPESGRRRPGRGGGLQHITPRASPPDPVPPAAASGWLGPRVGGCPPAPEGYRMRMGLRIPVLPNF